MAIDQAQCKKCRREGKKLFLKGERCFSSKCAIVKRNFIPGVHGPKAGKGKHLTGYGIQLREKQSAKKTYGLREKQFKNYYFKAIKLKADTGEMLYQFLECRLDNVLYRAGFFSSRAQSRQTINHSHFLVNGKTMNIPSYQVEVKDVISIKPTKVNKKLFENISETMKTKEVAEWLNYDPKTNSIIVIDLPDLKKSQPIFDIKSIIEFYSR